AGPQVRLLTTARQVVDIAHEALIRSWPRLRQWMDEDQEFQLWLKRLNMARQERIREQRNPDALPRGVFLEEARRWAEARPDDLNRDEKDFIEAGIYMQKLREQEELEQQRRLAEEQRLRLQAETERAEAQTRSAARLRKSAMALAGVAVVALVAAVSA